MKMGYLCYNSVADRVDIRFDKGMCHGGLHCGETLEAWVDGAWKPTRIECDVEDYWYLVGIGREINGLAVRL